MTDYIRTQIILALWLVPAYDLLEDRRTNDVIITKFFLLGFKMAESFENLDNIYVTARKISSKKVFTRYWTGTRSMKKTKKPFLFLESDSEKKYSSSLNRQSSETKPSAKIVIQINFEQNVNDFNLF